MFYEPIRCNTQPLTDLSATDVARVRTHYGLNRYYPVDLAALFNERSDRFDDGFRGFFDYYESSSISYDGIPFVVKPDGVNTVSSTVPGRERFDFFPGIERIRKVFTLGVGTYLAAAFGHETLWCANPAHFWWEIEYQDGTTERVFPRNRRTGRQEWSDILRADGSVERFPASPDGYVHLYEIEVADKPVRRVSMQDNFNPADYTVLALTVEAR
jgi:hypothetical protein